MRRFRSLKWPRGDKGCGFLRACERGEGRPRCTACLAPAELRPGMEAAGEAPAGTLPGEEESPEVGARFASPGDGGCTWGLVGPEVLGLGVRGGCRTPGCRVGAGGGHGEGAGGGIGVSVQPGWADADVGAGAKQEVGVGAWGGGTSCCEPALCWCRRVLQLSPSSLPSVESPKALLFTQPPPETSSAAAGQAASLQMSPGNGTGALPGPKEPLGGAWCCRVPAARC